MLPINHIIRLAILFTLMTFLISSCKKDKLAGEYERFKGTWKWSYTIINNYDTAGSLPNDTVFAMNCDDAYGLDLQEKGIIKSLKNGDVKKRKRIVVHEFGQTVSSSYVVIIHLNGNDKKTIDLSLGDEEILCTQNSDFTGLPFNNEEYSSIRFNSYYTRE